MIYLRWQVMATGTVRSATVTAADADSFRASIRANGGMMLADWTVRA